MEPTETGKRQKVECYNCYRLIPDDSKFCPYCGHNQEEKSGYTLRPNGSEQATQASQNIHTAQAPAPFAQPPTGPGAYGYSPYGQGISGIRSSEGFSWVDLAKYGGVVGTILFLAVVLMELAAAIYGFSYLPQMDAFPYMFPFYFITPFVVGVYAITGAGYGIIYVLFVMIAAVAFAYVLRNSGNFLKELRPVSRGIQSSTIFLIATLVMTYYFINMVVVLVVMGVGYPVSTPNFQSGPWFMTVWQLVFAPVWEEIAARVILIGLPLLIIAAVTRTSDRKWWQYLAGGNFEMKPAVVFFLILSSVMFGLGHWLADSGWGAWKILPAALSGLFMGYLFLKKGLYASIIFHFSVDSQALLILSPNSNEAVYYFVASVSLIWVIIGAVFFIYYFLVMLGFISSRNLLPQKVSERYVSGVAVSSSTAGVEAAPGQVQQHAVEPVHPYRPSEAGPVMRNPHAPVPSAPGEPVFGYICSNCGSLEARYKDGKFVCVYCGHESDK